MRLAAVALLCFSGLPASLAANLASPTFYRDVLPILRERCQQCHRPGEIGPMPLLTYRETRPWAKAIREAVVSGRMPPWFADPHYGKFSNDPTLSRAELDTLKSWVESGAPAGVASAASPAPAWPEGWSIGKPDAIFSMPAAFPVPATGELEYQYIIVPTNLTTGRWVQQVEIRPGDRSVVHHVVVYIRDPQSPWLRGMPLGRPFALPPESITRSDILFTYTPGNASDSWPAGMAKFIPAGSDLVFQMHYTPGKRPALDRTRIGLIYSHSPPQQRLLTLQLNSERFVIPPGHPNYRVHVSGTLPNDALLLSLYPHMHLRGKTFEYSIAQPGASREILLRVHDYDFYWQLTYRLAAPLLLRAGTRLEAVAIFDNSSNNPRNPDPGVAVTYGEQSNDEMMIGFFDVAVDARVDKSRFFERAGTIN